MEDRQNHERMLAVRDGDLDQLGPIFEAYHRRLYNYFLRLTGDPQGSDDLVQDTFHRILRSRHTYRGDGRFEAWIFSVARSAYLTHRRKNRRAQNIVPLCDSLEHPGPGPEEDLEARLEVRRLRLALSRLSEEKRESLLLSRFEDMKYEDIARVSGCAVGTVKARIHRALKDLTRIYTELGDDVQGMSGESA
jgi:RNA polymerase sigma factor (sigma-70 family)